MKAFIALAAALAVIGCSDSGTDTASTTSGTPATTSTGTSSTATTSGDTTPAQTPPAAAPAADFKPPVDRSPKDGEEVAVMDTSMGKIVLMFFPDKAPGHVKNFKDLAKKGFYDGTKFHRVVPGFMIQGGDPNTKGGDPSTWGSGGPGYNIKAEFNDVHHARGILSMARSQAPDTAGSQFFVVVADSGFLDHNYTAFGQVLSGMDTADNIVSVPTNGETPTDPPLLKSVKIVKWPVK